MATDFGASEVPLLFSDLAQPTAAASGASAAGTASAGAGMSGALAALGPVGIGIAIATAIPSIVKMFGGAGAGTATPQQLFRADQVNSVEALKQKRGLLTRGIMTADKAAQIKRIDEETIQSSIANNVDISQYLQSIGISPEVVPQYLKNIGVTPDQLNPQQLRLLGLTPTPQTSTTQNLSQMSPDQMTQQQIQSIAQPVPAGFSGPGVSATFSGQGTSPQQAVGQATFSAPTSATATPATTATTQGTQQNFMQQLAGLFGGQGGIPQTPTVAGSQPQASQGNWLTQMLQGTGQNFAQGLGQIPVVGGALQGGAEAIGGGLNNIGSFLSSLFGGQSGNPLSQLTGNQQPGGQPPMTGISTGESGQNDWMTQLQSLFNPNNIAGLGALGLGMLDDEKVQLPDFESNNRVQDLSNWTNTANHPLDPNVDSAIQRSMDIQNEQQLRNLRDVYKNARPGGDYLNDSAYQRDLANLNRSMALNTADAKAGSQLESNRQNIGIMSNLAQGSVGQNWAQAAFDTQRNTGRQKMFGDIASSFFGRVPQN